MATDRARSRFRWVQKNLASIRLRLGGHVDQQTDIASLDGLEYIGILARSGGGDDTHTHKLCLKTGGGRSCWAATYMRTGSAFNHIYTIEGSRGASAALLRVQKISDPLNRDAYLREIESSRALALAGLSPAVYATVFLRVLRDEEESMPVGKEDGMFVGVVMEMYQASLEDLDSQSIETLFFEHNTEDALVDLYAHAAAYVRCVDTKPANVVWKIGDGGKPVLGLIDVDPAFCGASSDPRSTLVVLPLTGRAGVSGLRRALREASEDWDAALQVESDVESDGKARVPALLVAAVSLLIFCVEAATGNPEDAYPYIRIADALLEYNVVMDTLLELDGKDEALPRETALSRLIYYGRGYLLRTVGPGTCDWQGAIRDALSRSEQLALRARRADSAVGAVGAVGAGRKKRKSARRRGCKTPRSPPRKRSHSSSRRVHDEGART
jgi:hypothetical protein